jgi:hypothetical protein
MDEQLVVESCRNAQIVRFSTPGEKLGIVRTRIT